MEAVSAAAWAAAAVWESPAAVRAPRAWAGGTDRRDRWEGGFEMRCKECGLITFHVKILWGDINCLV